MNEQRASEAVRRHFDLMARFPRYSWRNCVLIEIQRPGSKRVAGFSRWKRLGRQVKKGEHAIRIMAPCPFREARREADDDRNDRDVLTFFEAACVFDVS